MGKKKKILLFLFIISILLTSCSLISNIKGKNTENVVEESKINRYTMNANLDEINKILTVSQQINYKNTESVDLKELYFHVYANAFKQKETAPFLFNDFDSAYKQGFSAGYTDIESVYLVDKDVKTKLDFKLQGEGQTILKLALPTPLKPNATLVIHMDYKVHIPPASERFGYGNGFFNLGNWYPIAAVYDETGWNLDKYYAIGDPFYSDASDYDVNITTPESLTVAASGDLIEKTSEGTNTKWMFKAKDMRDFAFIANKQFKILEKKVQGTKVMSYYYGDEDKGKDALAYGVKSIELFNELFGKYPYNSYSVVQTEFPSGMEYPGLVYISDQYYKKDMSNLPLVITVVHETAHQWWYGIVGNDQIDEAWLDEGFAAYSETVFLERELGKEPAANYFKETVSQNVEEAMNKKQIDGVVLKSLKDFKTWDDYGPTVYDGGALMLSELRTKLGDKVFFDIMKNYVNEYKYKNAKTSDFVMMSEKISGQQLDDIFNSKLYKK